MFEKSITVTGNTLNTRSDIKAEALAREVDMRILKKIEEDEKSIGADARL